MTALYMVEMRLDPAALIRFAESQGINRRKDENLGYVAHSWLKAMFGGGSPKPFRLLHDRQARRPPRLSPGTEFWPCCKTGSMTNRMPRSYWFGWTRIMPGGQNVKTLGSPPVELLELDGLIVTRRS